MLLLCYTPFKIYICTHEIIVNSDVVYQHLRETEHLFGSTTLPSGGSYTGTYP